MAALIVLLIVASAVWVGVDAHVLGVQKGPIRWGILTLVIWVVGFPVYLAYRPGFKRDRDERIAYDDQLDY